MLDYETILISSCCKASVQDVSDRGRVRHRCNECGMLCYPEEVCAICHGTGEVETMEPVYAGEPHMAPIGVRPCICKSKTHDDE